MLVNPFLSGFAAQAAMQAEMVALRHQLTDIKISEASVAKYMVRSPKPPSRTWRTFLDNHVFLNWLQSTSSLSPRFGLKSCLSLSFSRMTADVWSTSTLRLIRPLNGLRSSCSKPFRSIRPRDIYCEIAIGSTGRSSATKSQEYTYQRYSRLS